MDETLKLAYETLQDCLSALNSLPDGALGYEEEHGWSYKRELTDKVIETQDALGQHMYYGDVNRLDERHPFG